MRCFSKVLAVLALAAVAPAQASSPCTFPQVELLPGMNATSVEVPLRLAGLGSDQATLKVLRVEAEDGSRVTARVDSGGTSAPLLWLNELGPGWYTLHVAVAPRGLESANRSWVAGKDEFWADVLVGRSEPGIARIDQCQEAGSTSLVIRWSEPVQFASSPLEALELVGDSGVPFSCLDRLQAPDAGYDGGFVTGLSLECSGVEDLTAVRVVHAPQGRTGVPATFPPEDELWETTAWVSERYPSGFSGPPSCRIWQPRLRLRTHENVSVGGLAPTYGKCDYQPGCTCASPLPSAAWWLGALLLARRARRRAR